MGLLAISCADEVGEYYETPRLVIQAHFADPLCAGDLALWEGQVRRLEDTLGIHIKGPIHVDLWSDDSPEALALAIPGCPNGNWGCYRPLRREVHSPIAPLDHELVHAVSAFLGLPRAFFHEGLASALTTRPVVRGVTTASLLDSFEIRSRRRLDYGTAGFFVRWLWETEGPGPIRALMSTRGSKSDFERSFGRPLEEAVAEFEREAPWAYPPFFTLPPPPLATDGDAWAETVDFDCSREDSSGRIGRISVFRHLEIPTPGRYALWSSADYVVVRRPITAPILSQEEAQRGASGAVTIPDARSPEDGRMAIIGAWELTVLDLDAATYTLELIDLDRDAEDAQVVIWPDRGPWQAGGDDAD